MNPESLKKDAAVLTTRGLGLAFYLLAFILFAANYALSHVLGIYFPLVLILVGPLLTIGTLTLIHPKFFDRLFDSNAHTAVEKAMKYISFIALLLGGLLGIFMFAFFRGDIS